MKIKFGSLFYHIEIDKLSIENVTNVHICDSFLKKKPHLNLNEIVHISHSV